MSDYGSPPDYSPRRPRQPRPAPFVRPAPRPPKPLTPEEMEKARRIQEEAKELADQISDASENMANTEADFREAHLGKAVHMLLLGNREISGTLVDINKYKIILDVDGVEKHYFKHAILAYHDES